MHQILTLNNISPLGLARLPKAHYRVGSDIKEPDAILVRSAKMHDMEIPASLKAVGRPAVSRWTEAVYSQQFGQNRLTPSTFLAPR